MLVIREATRSDLVIGTSRAAERVGLFFCGIGLLSLGMVLITLVDETMEWRLPEALLLSLAQYPAMLGVCGVAILFMQRRFHFLAEHKEVLYRQGLLEPKRHSFSSFAKVELLISASKLQGVVCLTHPDGKRMLVTRGDLSDCHRLADTVANFMGLPLTEEQSINKR